MLTYRGITGRARKQRWTERTKLATLQSKTLLLLIAGNINVLNPHFAVEQHAILDKKITLVHVICCYRKVSKKHCFSTEVDFVSYVSAEHLKPASPAPGCSAFVYDTPKYTHLLSKYIMYGLDFKHYEIASTPKSKVPTLTDCGSTLHGSVMWRKPSLHYGNSFLFHVTSTCYIKFCIHCDEN